MLLSLLVIIPFLSSFLSFLSYKFHKSIPRWIALIGILLIFFIIIIICFEGNYNNFPTENYPNWHQQLRLPWIPRFGIEFHLAIDNFSLLMLLLSIFLGIVSILCAWNDIKKNEGFFYLNLMLVFSGVIGVFIAVDLFLFFFFWEIMILPMYFLIALWGRESQKKRECISAANKFFIYTQLSSLIMLASILGLVFDYYQSTSILTFNYDLLLLHKTSQNIEYIIMLGFFLAFAIKMPIVPFHGWLPGLHVYSPICGAVEIIGILLKTAPYAFFRYNLVLFPNATQQFSFIAIFLGLFSLFYGSLIAFAQSNIKRIIAYSSISHMGLILIALYSNNEISLQGALIQILSNSISTTALCILSGQLYKRLHTYDISQMGGLWKCMYWIPAFTLFFSLSNLGMPGTGNFTGEFLVLFGLFQVFPFISVLSIIGISLSSIYSLNLIHKIFYGVYVKKMEIFSIKKQELFIIIPLILMLIILGLHPNIVLHSSYDCIHSIQKKFTNSISKIRFE